MAGQTVYSQFPAQALEGMADDDGVQPTCISRALTDAAGIGPGRVVKDGTTVGTTCAALTATGQNWLGVTRRQMLKEQTTPMFAQGADVAIQRDSFIWMTCIDDMRGVPSGGGSVYICTSGANAGLPQASSSGGDLADDVMQCLEGGNAGALGKFALKF